MGPLADAFLTPAEGHAVRLLPTDGEDRQERLRRADGRLIRGGEEPRYSTPELLTRERRTLDGAVARRNDAIAQVDDAVIAAALAHRPTLSDEQRHMITTLTRSGAGVQVVIGKAGSGKTFALDAAREAWQAGGVRVIGCALAARAAAGLQDGTGIPCDTLDRLLADLDRPHMALAAGSFSSPSACASKRLASVLSVTMMAGVSLLMRSSCSSGAADRRLRMQALLGDGSDTM